MLKLFKRLFRRNGKESEKIKNYYSWTNKNLELRETGKYGKGVFAKKGIKKGEILVVFGGYIMHSDEMLLSLPREISDNGHNITETLVMGIKHKTELELACFFNHSCNPNAGMKGQILLVAMRDIKKDEEITFDYATTLCRSKDAWPYIMHCRCGSANCRKIITDDDWKKKDLQEKYKGYFSFYIEEKINNIK